MGFSKPIIAPKIGVLNRRLEQQRQLLFKKDIKESFEAVLKLSEKELFDIGQRNFNSLKK